MMIKSSKNIMKAHCDSIGRVLRAVFWMYALYLAAMLTASVWIAFQPADNFMVQTADTASGIAAYTFFKGGFEVNFPRNLINKSAASDPKLVYMTGLSVGMAVKLLYLSILWFLRKIFKNIEKDETPFRKANCRSVFQIGVITIAAGHLESVVLPVLCVGLGIGGWGNKSLLDITSLLTGGVIICLSYIFEYGTELQQESDETL